MTAHTQTSEDAMTALRAHAETRSKHVDYGYLGGEPPRDWLADFRDLQNYRPCLTLEQTSEGWRLFADGIPSATRRDYRKRPIRYAVILAQGPGGVRTAGRDAAYRLVELLVTGIGSDEDYPARLRPLSLALDAEFTDEAWIAAALGPPNEEHAERARRNVIAALRRLGPPAVSPVAMGEPNQESWLGDAHNAEARGRFLAWAWTLLTGAGQPRDRAVIQNTVSTAGGLPSPPDSALQVVLANIAPKEGQRRDVRHQPIGGRRPKPLARPLPPRPQGPVESPEPPSPAPARSKPWWRRLLRLLSRLIHW